MVPSLAAVAVYAAIIEAGVIAMLATLLIFERRERMRFVRSLDPPKAEQTSLLDDLHVPQDVLGCR